MRVHDEGPPMRSGLDDDLARLSSLVASRQGVVGLRRWHAEQWCAYWTPGGGDRIKAWGTNAAEALRKLLARIEGELPEAATWR